MNDLVSKQAVLDAIGKVNWFTVTVDSNTPFPDGTLKTIGAVSVNISIDAFRNAVKDVPTVSAQDIQAFCNIGQYGGWVSVKDKLPESGKHVLLTCEVKSIDGFKKRYVCDGFYSKAHTLPQGHYPEDDVDYDYDEDEDEYYLKEGWYEVIKNWDDYSSVVICDFVTHWMPLPKPAQEETDNA